MTNMLPKDPIILLSYVNTKLRDQYSSLEELADDLHIDAKKDVILPLAAVGYDYNPEQKRFI